MADLNLGYFISIVKRDHPTWPMPAIRWQAQRMLERHPFVLKAYEAGKANGRDIRERLQHGLGVWWEELDPLTPEERGFVLALVKHEIGVSRPDGLALEAVAAKRETEAYEEQADALALDWRGKSSQPDKRVTHEAKIADLRKPKAN